MSKQAVKQRFENNSMEVALEALAASIARWTGKGDQIETAIPGLSLYRRIEPTHPASCMSEPSICLIAQRVKRVLLGDNTYVYDAHHFMITSVDLPSVCAAQFSQSPITYQHFSAQTLPESFC